jgi:hypothetical protein
MMSTCTASLAPSRGSRAKICSLSCGELAGVDHVVGQLPGGRQPPPLLGDPRLDTGPRLQRMPVPGFAEAVDENRVAGLEVEDVQPGAARLEHRASLLDGGCRIADPDVEHQRDLAIAVGVRVAQRQELVEHLGRQVHDGVIAQVLEHLGRLTLARSGQAGNDDHVLGRLGRAR